MEYLKAHWYWVLGAVIGLWIALKLFKSAGSSSVGANVSTPTGTNVIYGGTNANDAAVQAASIQAQTELAGQQIAAVQAVNLATIAYKANADSEASDLQKTQVLAANALAITNSNNQTAVIQSNNQTSVQLTTAQLGYQLGTTTAQLGYQLGLDTNAANLAALKDTNSTKLAAYGIQANVVNNQVNAARDVSVAQINANESTYAILTAAQIQEQQMAENSRQQQVNTVAGLIASGALNKGGEGGVNQVAALTTVLNPASAGSADAAAAGAAASAAASSAAMWNSISGMVNGGMKALFA